MAYSQVRVLAVALPGIVQEINQQKKEVKIMARTRMVTRTINVTECSVMACKVSTKEILTEVLELTGDTYTSENALKVLKKTYETEDYKIVALQEMNTREEIYGLPEVEFLKVATRLDENRKAVES